MTNTLPAGFTFVSDAESGDLQRQLDHHVLLGTPGPRAATVPSSHAPASLLGVSNTATGPPMKLIRSVEQHLAVVPWLSTRDSCVVARAARHDRHSVAVALIELR